jgi:HD-GYP domain-containing protein (c-di-GMP phosphodiesterase class II)
VLSNLRQAEEEYQEFRENWERQSIELQDMHARLAHVQQENNRLSSEVSQQTENLRKLDGQLQNEREQKERQRKRAEHMKEMVKEIHRSLFSGNIYQHILQACLALTGGTRGLYLTARGTEDQLKVRAAVEVEGYPQAPPSPYIQALCRKVLDEGEAYICDEAEARASRLPKPDREGERFHNCVAVPVMLKKNFDGILIVADKVSGEFDEDDVEAVLSIGDQAVIATQNHQLQRRLQSAYLNTVSTLADAVEAKDPYTRGHCDHVSRLANRVAAFLGLPQNERSLVCYSALLHDVGKIGVSDGILNKTGPLLPEEREVVRSHVRVGHDLICNVPELEQVAHRVLHHHEWYDGSGYPDGLKGDQIPIASRIVCVVDSYCAMISRRSYKEAYPEDRAREELARCAGSQFDPYVVEAFLSVVDQPEIEDDYDGECGLLPGFEHLSPLQPLLA